MAKLQKICKKIKNWITESYLVEDGYGENPYTDMLKKEDSEIKRVSDCLNIILRWGNGCETMKQIDTLDTFFKNFVEQNNAYMFQSQIDSVKLVIAVKRLEITNRTKITLN